MCVNTASRKNIARRIKKKIEYFALKLSEYFGFFN